MTGQFWAALIGGQRQVELNVVLRTVVNVAPFKDKLGPQLMALDAAMALPGLRVFRYSAKRGDGRLAWT